MKAAVLDWPEDSIFLVLYMFLFPTFLQNGKRKKNVCVLTYSAHNLQGTHWHVIMSLGNLRTVRQQATARDTGGVEILVGRPSSSISFLQNSFSQFQVVFFLL